MNDDSDHHGFALCVQQADGNIACQERDVGTGTSSYQDSKVVVTPEGKTVR
jgi:hypothetical protein